MLTGTGHLKWRHVYVIMTTEFDYFENDHILYTVGNNCKKTKEVSELLRDAGAAAYSLLFERQEESMRMRFGTSTGLSSDIGIFVIVTIKRKQNGQKRPSGLLRFDMGREKVPGTTTIYAARQKSYMDNRSLTYRELYTE